MNELRWLKSFYHSKHRNPVSCPIHCLYLCICCSSKMYFCPVAEKAVSAYLTVVLNRCQMNINCPEITKSSVIHSLLKQLLLISAVSLTMVIVNTWWLNKRMYATWLLWQKHHLLDCSYFPITCTRCGLQNIRRLDLSAHQDEATGDCPETIVQCKLNSFGCKFKVCWNQIVAFENLQCRQVYALQ